MGTSTMARLTDDARNVLTELQRDAAELARGGEYEPTEEEACARCGRPFEVGDIYSYVMVRNTAQPVCSDACRTDAEREAAEWESDDDDASEHEAGCHCPACVDAIERFIEVQAGAAMDREGV